MRKKKSSNFITFDDLSEHELIAFNKILDNIYIQRGADFRQYRPRCLRRRIVVRMHDNETNSFVDYLCVLENNPQEYDKLLDTITINVSEFFRNPETFDAVRQKIIPPILKRKKRLGSHILRIWSAGCATGEEPYSLAIMFKGLFVKDLSGFTATIYATDIDEEALKKANIGQFSINALKVFNELELDRYFTKASEDTYIIKPEYKSTIKFLHHNMINARPPNKMDIIFCRNVIIYFTRELQQRVYENFYNALIKGGFLVAGKVEALLGIGDGLFERIDVTERIFKKK